jgi:hypothetical protein
VGAGALVLVLILAITGGLGGADKHEKRHPAAHRRHHHAHRHAGAAAAGAVAFPLSVRARSSLIVCLVRGDGRPVIDAQALAKGAAAGPFTADRFRLDLDSGGGVRLAIAGKARRVHSPNPASYSITARDVKQIAFKGPHCP